LSGGPVVVGAEGWLAAPDPLLALLRVCVVRVDGDGEFRGSGFVVAPGEVLTCAHVVHGAREIVVRGCGWESSASVAVRSPDVEVGDSRARFYPLPDVALLRLDESPVGLPCVELDVGLPVSAPPADVLRLEAFTRGEHAAREVARSPASPECEGVFDEGGWQLVKLKGARVLGGFSGCPALNPRTGGVCAIVDSSRDPRADLGGFGVLVSQFLERLPGLRERNRAYHRENDLWQRAVAAQAQAAAMRSGSWRRLPLLEPLLELDWRREDPPSRLLRPRFAVVPLTGREELMAEMMRWRESDEAFSTLLVSGRGGFGKTRLAAEACAEAQRAGWTAGLLHVEGDADPEVAIDALAVWAGRLVVVVDYAETRPELVARLILRFTRGGGGPPVRLILVVRQGGTPQQLEDLFAAGGARDDIASVIRRAEPVRLESEELDRELLFERASEAFGRIAGAAHTARPPDLGSDRFARPLFVVAAAMLAANDPDVAVDRLGDRELMLALLDRHEAEYWERSDRRLGLNLDPTVRARAVAVAALMGAAGESEALAAVRIVPGLEDASDERARAIAVWLSGLYGSSGDARELTVSSLEPDLLAEALVARELESAPSLIGKALDLATERQLARALLVLSRVAAGSLSVADLIRAALDERIPGIIQQLARAREPDPELVGALHIATRVIAPVDGAIAAMNDLPERTLTLAPLALLLTRLAVAGFRQAVESDSDRFLPDLAMSLNNLSVRLGEAGRSGEALDAIQEAVKHYRALADALPERFLPDLAMSLNNLSVDLGEAGRSGEALDAIQEAVKHRRALADALPERFLPDLAMSLNNLSGRLGEAGRSGEALDAIQEAVKHYRALAEAMPERFLPDLAMSLNNLSVRLGEAGRSGEALDAIQEAVKHRRALAEAMPERFLPDLAGSLNNLSVRLGEAGRSGEALDASQEAVKHYRALAEAMPERFLPDLAMSLNNLSVRLGEAGRSGEALDAIQEAVKHRRALAEAMPERFLPDLASALNNLSNRLGEAGRSGEALDASQEAVKHRRALAEAMPERFLPDLAGSLNNLSVDLGEAGRSGEALDTIQEAVKHYRALAEAMPERFLPDLASALNNLSVRLGEAGRSGEALDASQEAVKHYRALAEAMPERFLPDLAGSLNNLSVRLGEAGRSGEALDTIQEAVKHRRALAEAMPERFLPDLAGSLNNLSVRLGEAGRSGEALDASQEAVKHRRALAEAMPERFLPDLAMSLNNLSVRLGEAGRSGEALDAIQEVVAEYFQSRRVGVLILCRARHFDRRGELAAAIADARAAVEQLDPIADPVARADARSFLRRVKSENSAEFDQAWSQTSVEEQPLWLRLAYDATTGQRLVEWVQTQSWTASEELLSEHASTLLTDQADATLEHLIDQNPGNTTLLDHLNILRTARSRGIETTYAELNTRLRHQALLQQLDAWIATPTWDASRAFLEQAATDLLQNETEVLLTSLVEQHPDGDVLLAHLGLLNLCRLVGLDTAYDELQADAMPVGDPHERLARARLRTGLNPEDQKARFEHALAALEDEQTVEAERAIAHFARSAPTWERQAKSRQLDNLSAERPDLRDAINQIKRALVTTEPSGTN
jgi:Trypsin-like peptidase domain/Tetratricopeptide repeat